MIPIDLTHHRALITGATGKLGPAMARTLAAAGADIIVHYRQNQHDADALVTEIQSRGRTALAVQADITEKDSIDAMRDHIASSLGPPDILVTNAVIQYDWKTILLKCYFQINLFDQ